MKEMEDNKKERKTCGGAKREKISSPNQTAAASSWLSVAGVEVCVFVCISGCVCVWGGGGALRRKIDSPVFIK